MCALQISMVLKLGANVMPDLSTIGAALTSFNTLKNIAQTMIGLHDRQALQVKVIEFNNAIIDAQTKVFLVNEERTALGVGQRLAHCRDHQHAPRAPAFTGEHTAEQLGLGLVY